MDRERLERLRRIEGDHFWFVGRREIVADAIAAHASAGDGHEMRRVVDVGCGTGETAHRLFSSADQRRISLVMIEPLASAPPLIRARLPALPVADRAADVCLALDVLEHVDDAAALSEIRRVLSPGGVLVATVPAHPWLWSVRDDDAGHLRRYTRRSLRAVTETAGLRVDRLSAFHATLFPAIVAARLIAGRSRRARDLEELPNPLVNRLATSVVRAEAGLHRRRLRPPIGGSLLLVASVDESCAAGNVTDG